jgi:NADH dehydrogenase [ubiquinone] 1 alpha subcomplex assembly factor 7
MFGELIGLWLADMWINAGREAPVHYVELGPGRGTLARDALTAARRYGLTPQVHLVETSPELKDVQLTVVPGAQWHHDLSTIPMYGPVLLVANEFLDALPVRQLVKLAEGWRERMVDCRDGQFIPVAGSQPMDAALPEARRQAADGTIIETCPGAAAAVYEVAGRLLEQGGAALFIDYGHDELRAGSTLQAVRDHRSTDPFAAPGEADLTAHVDFASLAQIALSRGVRWLGTVPQGRWLRELGIETRADNLAAFAPEHASAIQAAKDRLIGEGQMGALFKVMGLSSPNWPGGAGF